jgi:ATP-dependent protease ClpP protease subunit
MDNMDDKKTKTVIKPMRSSDVFSAVKASDSKLSQAAMHLEYLFDKGVNFIERTITISGPIESPWFDTVDAAMSEFERANRKGVTIRIFSEGGSVYEALAIVGRLRKSKCHITTEGYGCIMSAATIILACGDSRKMSEFATFMHHEAAYELPYDRHSNHSSYVKQAEREEQLWCKWMARFSKKPPEFWGEFGKHVDSFFFADECLEHGVIDEVIGD